MSSGEELEAPYALSFSLSPRAKLHQNAALVQVPIGLESSHEGVVDVIRNRAVYFSGDFG